MDNSDRYDDVIRVASKGRHTDGSEPPASELSSINASPGLLLPDAAGTPTIHRRRARALTSITAGLGELSSDAFAAGQLASDSAATTRSNEVNATQLLEKANAPVYTSTDQPYIPQSTPLYITPCLRLDIHP